MKTNLKLQPNFETAAASAAEEIVYRQRDVLGIAQARVAAGLTMAGRLRRAGMACGSAVVQHRAFLMEQCASLENIWVAQNLDSENPESGLVEMFDGAGSLAPCGSRLCPSCCADLRRRSRARARAGLDAAGRYGNESLKFVTLTSPTARGASVLESIAYINGAFARLRKKAFWQSRVRGAIKGVEVTVGSVGYHAHIHLIVVGGFLERGAAQEKETVAKRAKAAADAAAKAAAKGRPLSAVPSKSESLPLGNLQSCWAECLLAEANARGWFVARSEKEIEAVANVGGVWLDWRAAAESGVLVDVRKIRGKGDNYESEAVSKQAALNEVLKYTTKGSDWLKLPDSELVEVASVRRWARMFEVLGDCKDSTSGPTVNFENAALLDTPYLSGTEVPPETGSVRVTESGESETYIEGAGWVAAASAYLVAFLYGEEEFLPAPASPVAAAPAPVALPRSESLLRLAETMPFDEWCVLVKARLSERRFIRRRLLSQKFEHATFWNLNGHRWGLLPVVEEI